MQSVRSKCQFRSHTEQSSVAKCNAIPLNLNLELRMHNLRQISSDAPQTNAFIKMVIVEETLGSTLTGHMKKFNWQVKVCQAPAQQASEKIIYRLKSISLSGTCHGGQVPKICYFMPWKACPMLFSECHNYLHSIALFQSVTNTADSEGQSIKNS